MGCLDRDDGHGVGRYGVKAQNSLPWGSARTVQEISPSQAQHGGTRVDQVPDVVGGDVPVAPVLRHALVGHRHALQDQPAQPGATDPAGIAVRPCPTVPSSAAAHQAASSSSSPSTHSATAAPGRRPPAVTGIREQAQLVALGVAQHHPAAVVVEDRGPQGDQVGGVAAVQVEVDPVLRRLGLGHPVDPQC